MNKSLRLVAFLGLSLFAVSFFLPPGFYNSPRERFLWSREAVFPFDGSGMPFVFIGVSVLLIYPYLWAALASLAFLFPGSISGRAALRGQLLCHLLGLAVLTVLGVSMLVLRDDFLPRGAQWAAATVPVFLFLAMLGAARFCRPDRRVPAITALGLLLFTPLHFIVGYLVVLDGGRSWGYFLGGIGSVAALAGSIGLFIKSDTLKK